MDENCPSCGSPLEWVGGASAHPSNQYCTDEIGCGWRAWEREIAVTVTMDKAALSIATEEERESAIADLFMGLATAITKHGCRVDLSDPKNIVVSKRVKEADKPMVGITSQSVDAHEKGATDSASNDRSET